MKQRRLQVSCERCWRVAVNNGRCREHDLSIIKIRDRDKGTEKVVVLKRYQGKANEAPRGVYKSYNVIGK
jgi:hypothetical protein